MQFLFWDCYKYPILYLLITVLRGNCICMPYRQLTTYQAVITQARAYRTLRSFMVETLRKYDLTLTEWLMIGSVIDAGKDGTRISELADVLGVEMPVITNLVNRAVKDGWVTRVTDKTDRRSKRISATRLGGEKACVIEGELRAETKDWLSNLDSDMVGGYLAVVAELSLRSSPCDAS